MKSNFLKWALACLSLLLYWPLAAQDQEPPADSVDTSKPLPLKAERNLAIDLDEGSWISLDVSPDGSTIVFDYLGDLYTLPVSGGTATQVTSGMAFDSQPHYSPDGSSILFLSDRDGGENLWIINQRTQDTSGY